MAHVQSPKPRALAIGAQREFPIGLVLLTAMLLSLSMWTAAIFAVSKLFF
jgi:hypothetical protein